MKTSFEKFMASTAVKSVELGEHKVELALVDDAKKIVMDFGVNLKEIETNGKEFEKYAIAIERYGEMGLELFKKSSSMVDKLEAAYKALGVDPNVSNEYKTLVKQMDTLLTYRKRYSF
jgi:hypothetical protein